MNRDDDREALSSDGARRRDAMLELLLAAQRGEVRRRRRVARTVQATAACVLLAAAVAALWTMRPSASSVAPPRALEAPMVAEAAPDALPRATSPALVLRVPGDPTVLDRLRAVGTGQTQWLNDDDLLERLRASGRPTGLIRIDGRTTLTADVTDRRRAEPRS